jgi:hypothetical protein
VAVIDRNTGAETMAGLSMGALSPAVPSSSSAPRRTLHLVPGSTRTRRNHGVFLFGNELATVYSSRRESDGLGVTMTVGSGSLVLTGGMTPTQARAMARALSAAADAADTAQAGGAQ